MKPSITFTHGKTLGECTLVTGKFPEADSLFKEFSSKEFQKLGEMQKSERINRGLLALIQSQASEPCFLLAAVVDYIDRVNEKGLLETYSFSLFELWLNQFSNLSREENYQVRAAIIGKAIPRDAYQSYFPIGMGKIFPGSHYVTAHASPDLDTTIASFWGWIDAFGARVSEGLHLWNVPGGPPSSQIEIGLLFTQVFGKGLFEHVAKTRVALGTSSLDIMSQKGLVKKFKEESTFTIDHERNQNAVVLIDEHGYYLGDWRNFDVEGFRGVVMLLNGCLRWFENVLHVKLISLFAKASLSAKDIPAFVHTVFDIKIKESDPAKDFSEKQKSDVHNYLVKVLKVSKGLESTFAEFADGVQKLSLMEFHEFIEQLKALEKSPLFDKSGNLHENRPLILGTLEKIITGIDRAIYSVRNYVERLEVALEIKRDVFGYLPHSISYRAEIEEIRSKIGNYPNLTVTIADKDGKLIPLGVVHATDVHKPILGTVTVRDFCNRDETKIPPYLEVISVIDHHKTSLHTTAAPVAFISDAQSSNALVAELAFKINDQYSTGGMPLDQIEAQIKYISKDLSSAENKRVLQRLLQKLLNAQAKTAYFIHPAREVVEYLHFLFGILDDTDLLTKVSTRDVECVASLLNRLKSLVSGKELEIISFDDIKRDEKFAHKAAQRLLQNGDLYSLYRKIYLAKEELVEQNLQFSSKGEPSSIFADTKEQNGCCRVGQSKLFAKNFPSFFKLAPEVRLAWFKKAQAFYNERKEFDLHIHMISTIAGAEDLYAGKEGDYKHKDEMWIWIPSTEQAIEHLKSFLNAFRNSPAALPNEFEVAFLGENAKELDQIFTESFKPTARKTLPEDLKKPIPIAILRFKAGLLNSRKAMVSPFLPSLAVSV